MSTPSLPPSPPLPASSWRTVSAQQAGRIVLAFEQRDFRYFLLGAFLSNIGSWMQSIAQAWLVFQMTNSAFYLGLDGFANTIPIAIFTLMGGVIADRFDRRPLLIFTQCLQLTFALALGILIQTHHIRVWHVIGFSFLTGLTQAVAWPVYQTVVANIVKREHLSNAIALNSTQFNMARMIGPVLGAMALGAFGTAGCFYANSVSFLAVIIALLVVHIPHNRHDVTQGRPGYFTAFKEGFVYMRSQGMLFWMLMILAASSVLGVPMMTLLPVFARDILKIGAPGYGVLMGAFGTGAVISGLLVAFWGNAAGREKYVMRFVFVFVASMIVFSLSRNLLLSLMALFFAGFAMVGFASIIYTLIQTNVPDHLRGRAMSLFVFSFGGFMPFGNLMAGFLAKHIQAPHTVLLQGLLFGAFAVFVHQRVKQTLPSSAS